MKLPATIIATIAATLVTLMSYVASIATLHRICNPALDCAVHDSPLLVICLLFALTGIIFCFLNALRSIDRSDNTRWDIFETNYHMSQGDMCCWAWMRVILITITVGIIFLIFTGFYAYGTWPGYYGWNWITGLLHIGTSFNSVLFWHPNYRLKDFSSKR